MAEKKMGPSRPSTRAPKARVTASAPTVALPTKLIPCDIGHVIPRPRLFEALDAQLGTQLIWIWGSAGSGKTALAASWLARGRLRSIWYQVDRGDRDPANFFYFLRMACAVQPGGATHLPQFAPEYRERLQVYARSFLRALFSRPDAPQCLVLDDCHELEEDDAFFGLLGSCLGELPQGTHILFTSRRPPPPAWAPLQWRRQLFALGEDTLRFTEEEVREAAERGEASHDMAQAIVSTTGGWAAGVNLWLEQLAHGARAPGWITEPGQRSGFDFLAGVSLARLNAPQRAAMLGLSLLPNLPHDLAVMALGEGAPVALDGLQNHSRLLSRVAGPMGQEYRMHDLLRDFACQRALAEFPPERVRDIRSRAAQACEQAGLAAPAIELWLALGDLERAAARVLQTAPALYATGRWQQLVDWLDALAARGAPHQSWFRYWQAMGRLTSAPLQARAMLADCFTAFADEGDARGLYLAWRGYVDTFAFEWGKVTPLANWIERLRPYLMALPPPDPDTQRLTATGVLVAMMLGAPDSPDIDFWVSQVRQEVFSNEHTPTKLRAGCVLMMYYDWWIGDGGAIQALGDRLAPLAELEPPNSLAWYHWATVAPAYFRMSGDTERALDFTLNAQKAAAESGTRMFDFMLELQLAFSLFTLRRLKEVEQCIARIGALLEGGHRFSASVFHYLCSRLAALHGDLSSSIEHARVACEIARSVGTPFDLCNTTQSLATALLVAERHPEAADAAQEALTCAEGIHSAYHGFIAASLLARAHIGLGQEAQAERLLAQWLPRAEQAGLQRMNFLMLPFAVQGVVFKFALNRGIEPGFTRLFITQRRLPCLPAGGVCIDWPWPVRVRLLGVPELHLLQEEVRFAGKAQAKPLEMLHYACAMGGRQVPIQQIQDALWPDAEGDMGRRALDTTLYRLRKVLGDAELVQTTAGTLSLDARRVGCDVWDLRLLLHAVADQSLSLPQWARWVADLDHLCRGILLELETHGWLGEAQKRLALDLQRGLEPGLRALTQAQAWADLARLAEVGLRCLPGEEVLHRAALSAAAQRQAWADFDAASRRASRVLGLPGREEVGRRLVEWAQSLDVRARR